MFLAPDQSPEALQADAPLDSHSSVELAPLLISAGFALIANLAVAEATLAGASVCELLMAVSTI